MYVSLACNDLLHEAMKTSCLPAENVIEPSPLPRQYPLP